MRFRVLISALLACTSAPLFGQATTAPSADEVIARMFAHDVQRDAAAGGYTGNRQYILDNPSFDKQSRMTVSVACGPDGSKNFLVVSEDGWISANNRVLRRMLETESEASRPTVRSKARMTADNYEFQFIKAAPLNGRLAYVIDVTPKRRDEYLFRGRIWVDAEDFALARVEGEPARNLSIWIRNVHFTQEYRKNGEYWFPWSTTSISEARIFGRTEVDIHYFDYLPRTAKADRDTNRRILEARNVKH